MIPGEHSSTTRIMISRRASQACEFWRLICLTVAVTSSVTCCSDRGTEGDALAAASVGVTPCKVDARYARSLVETQSSAATDAPQITNHDPRGSATGLGSALDYGGIEQALVARDETPLALECLQWNYGGGSAMLFVRNFAGPCSVVWEGETTLRAAGDVVISLRNSSCDIARCGSCLYDADAELASPLAALVADGSDSTRVTLELRDCNGELTRAQDWEITLEERGDSCRPVEGWSWVYDKASQSGAFSETQLNLYAPCGDSEGAVECTEDRSCNGGYCVPGCGSDVDCPLDGALTCRDGACMLKP